MYQALTHMPFLHAHHTQIPPKVCDLITAEVLASLGPSLPISDVEAESYEELEWLAMVERQERERAHASECLSGCLSVWSEAQAMLPTFCAVC